MSCAFACVFLGRGQLWDWGEMPAILFELRGFRIMKYCSRGVWGDSFEVVFILDVVVERCKIIKSFTMDGVGTNRLSCHFIEPYRNAAEGPIILFLRRICGSLPPIYVSQNRTARQKIKER